MKGSEVSIVIGVVSVERKRLKAAENGREMAVDRDERRDRAISTFDFFSEVFHGESVENFAQEQQKMRRQFE